MAIEKYIKCLETNNFDFSKYNGGILAYMRVLEIDGCYSKFIDIDVARKILSDIEDKKIVTYIKESL